MHSIVVSLALSLHFEYLILVVFLLDIVRVGIGGSLFFAIFGLADFYKAS